MHRHGRWLSVVGILAAALASAGADTPRPYLPLVGPPPLRFALPPVPPLVPPTLPPLEEAASATNSVTEQPAQTALNQLAQTASGASTNAGADFNSVVPQEDITWEASSTHGFVFPLLLEPFPNTSTNNPTGTFSGAGEHASMLPQMYMRYFTLPANTHSHGLSIVTPVPFIPPQPLPGSSSARFETKPNDQP